MSGLGVLYVIYGTPCGTLLHDTARSSETGGQCIHPPTPIADEDLITYKWHGGEDGLVTRD